MLNVYSRKNHNCLHSYFSVTCFIAGVGKLFFPWAARNIRNSVTGRVQQKKTKFTK